MQAKLFHPGQSDQTLAILSMLLPPLWAAFEIMSPRMVATPTLPPTCDELDLEDFARDVSGGADEDCCGEVERG